MTKPRIADLQKEIEELKGRLVEKSRPSWFSRVRSWLAVHGLALLAGLVVGVVVGMNAPSLPSLNILKPSIERKAASEVAEIPFLERAAVAAAYRAAAERIAADPGNTAERYDADEEMRRSVAMQPSAKEWQRATRGLTAIVCECDHHECH